MTLLDVSTTPPRPDEAHEAEPARRDTATSPHQCPCAGPGVVSSLSREALPIYSSASEANQMSRCPPAPAGSVTPVRHSGPRDSSTRRAGRPAGASRSPAPARCSLPPPRPVRWPGSTFRAARRFLRSSPAAAACSLGARPRCFPAPATRPSAPPPLPPRLRRPRPPTPRLVLQLVCFPVILLRFPLVRGCGQPERACLFLHFVSFFLRVVRYRGVDYVNGGRPPEVQSPR